MPILPRRRPMGPTSSPPFRRRTPPTPQATRLMRVSLGAGILFVVVLGLVFVPRGLQYGDVDRPSIVLSHSGTGPFLVEVASASRAHPLSAYRAEVNITNGSANVNVDVPGLDEQGPWGGGIVEFADSDEDGILSAGDAFSVREQPGPQGPWTYAVQVFYVPSDVNASPPCPCAVGRIVFAA